MCQLQQQEHLRLQVFRCHNVRNTDHKIRTFSRKIASICSSVWTEIVDMLSHWWSKNKNDAYYYYCHYCHCHYYYFSHFKSRTFLPFFLRWSVAKNLHFALFWETWKKKDPRAELYLTLTDSTQVSWKKSRTFWVGGSLMDVVRAGPEESVTNPSCFGQSGCWEGAGRSWGPLPPQQRRSEEGYLAFRPSLKVRNRRRLRRFSSSFLAWNSPWILKPRCTTKAELRTENL